MQYVNREKQTISHTLRSKMIVRKKHELKTANKRIFTKVEIYLISHKKNDGSFVNDEEQLVLLQANESSLNDDAYIKLFGKEHPNRFKIVVTVQCKLSNLYFAAVAKTVAKHLRFLLQAHSGGSKPPRFVECLLRQLFQRFFKIAADVVPTFKINMEIEG
ncbi:hypothetical protein Ahy_B02g057990 [Arachis hypogaea]|uniref:Uncharacterized protein n=1 Tax=Arachis hypogaea TaxID=3818 RepID=A0A445ADJ1_ARAHY|nr:hypothetical protein Ahy_B02g057990 [Arachis hypogaea]